MRTHLCGVQSYCSFASPGASFSSRSRFELERCVKGSGLRNTMQKQTQSHTLRGERAELAAEASSARRRFAVSNSAASASTSMPSSLSSSSLLASLELRASLLSSSSDCGGQMREGLWALGNPDQHTRTRTCCDAPAAVEDAGGGTARGSSVLAILALRSECRFSSAWLCQCQTQSNNTEQRRDNT